MRMNLSGLNERLNANFSYNPEDVGETILAQLGGNRFLVMTGAKNLIWDEKAATLTIALPKNGSKANRLAVTYNKGRDTYTARFYRHTGGTFSTRTYTFTEVKEKDIKVYEDVFCDQLEEIFEETTGMYTRF